jgi:two-component system sensor histidine kinase SenX3
MRDVIDRCAQAALADEATAQPRRDVALTHVAIEVLLDYAVGAHLQAARVSCRAEGALPLCLSDEQMLLAIVSNLLDNALKYSLDDSIVRLSARATHRSGRQGVVVCVVNEVGVAGRPDETRLFEKYHRGERARHRSGSGLGLYLSNRLAARIGAELRLRPEGGSLVCFELWVPASASAPAVT